MNRDTARELQSSTEPPSAPAEPFACYVAKGFRTLMQSEGLDDSILPEDFSRRIFKGGDCIPPEPWKYFATKPRKEQGQLVFNLIQLIWAHYTDQMTVFPPGSEYIVAPPEMLGVDWLRRIVAELDYLCLPGLGLDGCRSTDFRGRITYPEVEEVRDRTRQYTVGRYGLYSFERLKQWVSRFEELYGPYQPGIVNDLTNPKIVKVVALQIKDLNPDILN